MQMHFCVYVVGIVWIYLYACVADMEVLNLCFFQSCVD